MKFVLEYDLEAIPTAGELQNFLRSFANSLDEFGAMADLREADPGVLCEVRPGEDAAILDDICARVTFVEEPFDKTRRLMEEDVGVDAVYNDQGKEYDVAPAPKH